MSTETSASETKAQQPTETKQPIDEQQQQQEQQQEEGQKGQPLALPAPPTDGTQQIDVSGGGGSIKLDHLGPLVVNSDGTLSRIANWENMTEIERRNTLRVLGKRNQLRLATLKGEGGGEETKKEE
ncbi:hypothetical protein M432DRAFT_587390 [Thermoascus aurantiacus ATCC 26904]